MPNIYIFLRLANFHSFFIKNLNRILAKLILMLKITYQKFLIKILISKISVLSKMNYKLDNV